MLTESLLQGDWEEMNKKTSAFTALQQTQEVDEEEEDDEDDDDGQSARHDIENPRPRSISRSRSRDERRQSAGEPKSVSSGTITAVPSGSTTPVPKPIDTGVTVHAYPPAGAAASLLHRPAIVGGMIAPGRAGAGNPLL